MKVRVDSELCVGHGRCYEIAPDVFGDDTAGGDDHVLADNHAVADRGPGTDVNRGRKIS